MLAVALFVADLLWILMTDRGNSVTKLHLCPECAAVSLNWVNKKW